MNTTSPAHPTLPPRPHHTPPLPSFHQHHHARHPTPAPLHPPRWRVLHPRIQTSTVPPQVPRNSSGLRSVLSSKANEEGSLCPHEHQEPSPSLVLILHHPLPLVTDTTQPAILHRRRILHPPQWRVLHPTIQTNAIPPPPPGIRPDFARFFP